MVHQQGAFASFFPRYLLASRGRASDLMQVCFTTLYVFHRHFVRKWLLQLLHILAKTIDVISNFPERLNMLSKKVFVTFLIPNSSNSSIPYLQIVLL